MERIVQIKGNVTYSITLDPSVWLLDDRKKRLEDALKLADKGLVDFQEIASACGQDIFEMEEKLTFSSFSPIWDRLRLFPFTCPIKNKDSNLKAKLDAEKSGIFNWILEGLEMVLQEKEIFDVK